jgi:hypothetical protein
MTELMPLDDLLAGWVPGSQAQPWTWEDEERHILASPYDQARLEASINALGFTGTFPILLGHDGRVWDGHHRVVAARRLGLTHVPVERVEEETNG